MLLGGVIVKFDKLHPILASQNVVPLSGDVMVSRWAFEALSVNQFKSNAFEKFFYPYDKVMSIASYKRNYWQSELKKRLETCKIYHDDAEKKEWVQQSFKVIQNEIYQESLNNSFVVLKMDLKAFMALSTFDIATENILSNYLIDIKTYYNNLYNAASVAKNKMMGEVHKAMPSKEDFVRFRDDYQNENLSDLVKNANTVNKIIEFNDELIQKVDPIYQDGQGFRAHFFAPTKQIFGKKIDTFWVNLGVIWLLSLTLFVTLYLNTLKKLLNFLDNWGKKISFAKNK